MMFYTSVGLALLVGLVKVHANDDDEAIQACINVFQPANFKKVCCQTIANYVNINVMDDFNDCGVDKSGNWTCNMSECILKKSGILVDGDIDYEKSNANLQEFAKAHPDTQDIVNSVVENCAKGNYEDGMPDMCDAMKYHNCVVLSIAFKCPEFKKDDICQTMAKDVSKCKEYVLSH